MKSTCPEWLLTVINSKEVYYIATSKKSRSAEDGEKELSLGPRSEGGGISPVTHKVFSDVESFLMSLCWKLRCNV